MKRIRRPDAGLAFKLKPLVTAGTWALACHRRATLLAAKTQGTAGRQHVLRLLPRLHPGRRPLRHVRASRKSAYTRRDSTCTSNRCVYHPVNTARAKPVRLWCIGIDPVALVHRYTRCRGLCDEKETSVLLSIFCTCPIGCAHAKGSRARARARAPRPPASRGSAYARESRPAAKCHLSLSYLVYTYAIVI